MKCSGLCSWWLILAVLPPVRVFNPLTCTCTPGRSGHLWTGGGAAAGISAPSTELFLLSAFSPALRRLHINITIPKSTAATRAAAITATITITLVSDIFLRTPIPWRSISQGVPSPTELLTKHRYVPRFSAAMLILNRFYIKWHYFFYIVLALILKLIYFKYT